MIYIGVQAIRKPAIAPVTYNRAHGWRDYLSALKKILPVFCVIGLVLGLIYTGLTTPTEAGAIGALSAIIVTFLYGNLSWKNVLQASFATIRTTCMIMFIIVGASILSSSLAYLRIPQSMASAVAAADISRYVVIFILALSYFALGCLFDGVSLLLLTLPIVYPMILALGFNGIWFGVVVTILIETAQVTPPVGFNLYVLQNISGESIGVIVRGAIPFVLLLLLGVVLLVIFPEIALFLPSTMSAR